MRTTLKFIKTNHYDCLSSANLKSILPCLLYKPKANLAGYGIHELIENTWTLSIDNHDIWQKALFLEQENLKLPLIILPSNHAS